MHHKSLYSLLLLSLSSTTAFSAVPEVESNDTRQTANVLSKTDENVGQMNGATDQDYYSIQVTDPNQVSTPVYFGCNFKLGDFYTVGATDTDKSIWRVSYYNSAGDLQGNYNVDSSNCKQGTADTTGPLRFEMNTKTPGTYYIMVTGRYIGTRSVSQLVYDAGTGKYEAQQVPVEVYIANTGDYKIRVYTGRTEGQVEPNDGMTDAYPIVKSKEVRGQSSSQYDQDWYYFDTDTSTTTSKSTNFFFKCGDAAAGTSYMLSSYDAQGVLQSSYNVNQAQCSTSTGYKMIVNTPTSARYYVLVSPPTYTDTTQFTQSDYIVSSSSIATSVDPGTTDPGTTIDVNAATGVLKSTSIVDSPTAGKDTFSATVGQCGTTKGVVKLSGSNLNLSGLTADSQVKVVVDGWSCTSDTKTTTTSTNSKGKTTYTYPKPATPTPASKPAQPSYSG